MMARPDHPRYVQPVVPTTWIPLAAPRDAAAIAHGRAILDAGTSRLGFDCGWDAGPDMDVLGFEVSRHGHAFATWTSSGGLWGEWPSFDEAVRETFLTGGCLE